MKTYEVTHISGAPDWESVPCAVIENRLWSNVDGIVPSAQVCWDENALYVRLQTREENILRRFTGFLEDVYKDSCLEFFFCPEVGSDRYFNFEINPNGAMYVGFGGPRPDRCRLFRPDFGQLFQVNPFEAPGLWGVELQIPVSFLQTFVPDFQLCSGQIIPANFYKCGDETTLPHFMAWNKVDVPEPNFHLPEFFGQLLLK
jgi:hypothetical protein